MVGFLDCRFTFGVARLLESVHIRDAFSCGGVRRVVPGWHASSCVVDHSTIGGITGTRLRLHCFHFGVQAKSVGAALSAVGRDASTVLSQTVYCRRFRLRPAAQVLVPLRVELGQSGSISYVHGGGLLPAGAFTSTWVLTPHVRGPRGCWGSRSVGRFQLSHLWFGALYGPLFSLIVGFTRLGSDVISRGGDSKTKRLYFVCWVAWNFHA